MPQNKSSGGLMAVEGREFNQTTFSPWTQLYTPQETSSITQQKVTLWIYFHMNFIWLKKLPQKAVWILLQFLEVSDWLDVLKKTQRQNMSFVLMTVLCCCG